MSIYSEDGMETKILHEDANETKPLVFVVYGGLCFPSNDRGNTGWFDENHRHIRPKDPGRSLIVSAFLCECIRISDEIIRDNPVIHSYFTQFIKPGTNGEG